MRKATHAEVAVWKTVGDSPHCVGLHEVFEEECVCFMVMERCLCGLFEYLEQKQELNERTIGAVFVQMLQGIQHLHSVHVCHRDIKPENFLVGGADGETVKLADFGLACKVPANGIMTGVYGTAPFMCPVMLQGLPYYETVDVWSMGVIVYSLLYGHLPYQPKEQTARAMKKAIVEGAPPSFLSLQTRSASAIKFVRALLQRDVDKRLTATEALSMTFMVEAANGSHMSDYELPSLRHSLFAARKGGAFDIRDPTKKSSLDDLLNEKQISTNGVPLPDVVRQSGKVSRVVTTSKSQRKTTSTEAEVVSTPATAWDNQSTQSSVGSTRSPSSGTKSPVSFRSIDRSSART
jgi:serine/threonine protein kinase